MKDDKDDQPLSGVRVLREIAEARTDELKSAIVQLGDAITKPSVAAMVEKYPEAWARASAYAAGVAGLNMTLETISTMRPYVVDALDRGLDSIEDGTEPHAGRNYEASRAVLDKIDATWNAARQTLEALAAHGPISVYRALVAVAVHDLGAVPGTFHEPMALVDKMRESARRVAADASADDAQYRLTTQHLPRGSS